MGAPSTLWVVSRPHNWRPPDAREWLLHLHAANGSVLGRAQLGSRFAHDVVRRRDRVYVASTGDGRLLELSFPGMQLVRGSRVVHVGGGMVEGALRAAPGGLCVCGGAGRGRHLSSLPRP